MYICASMCSLLSSCPIFSIDVVKSLLINFASGMHWTFIILSSSMSYLKLKEVSWLIIAITTPWSWYRTNSSGRFLCLMHILAFRIYLSCFNSYLWVNKLCRISKCLNMLSRVHLLTNFGVNWARKLLPYRLLHKLWCLKILARYT